LTFDVAPVNDDDIDVDVDDRRGRDERRLSRPPPRRRCTGYITS
jgi:hypothetical protein